MAGKGSENEELAGVVVADKPGTEDNRPWYVVLRPWLFCLCFLIAFEVGTRLVFDYTLNLHHERFDNFPSAASEDVYVNQMTHDKAFKIVMIGDSVIVGPSLLEKDQTIPRYLEETLQKTFPDRPIHVWNFSVAGVRSTDQYSLLLKALDSNPDMVILTGNYITFTSEAQKSPVFVPFASTNLPTVPPHIAPLLDKEKFNQHIETELTTFFEKNIRFLGMRHTVNAMLFGVQPRAPIDTPNPMVAGGVTAGRRLGFVKMENWRKRKLDPKNYQAFYTANVPADHINGLSYAKIWELLKGRDLLAFTYITPQNPGYIEQYINNPAYHYMTRDEYDKNRETIKSFFDPRIPFKDFSDLLPDELFYDNDHLMAEGNRQLAEAIANEIRHLVSTRLGNALVKAPQSAARQASAPEDMPRRAIQANTKAGTVQTEKNHERI